MTRPHLSFLVAAFLVIITPPAAAVTGGNTSSHTEESHGPLRGLKPRCSSCAPDDTHCRDTCVPDPPWPGNSLMWCDMVTYQARSTTCAAVCRATEYYGFCIREQKPKLCVPAVEPECPTGTTTLQATRCAKQCSETPEIQAVCRCGPGNWLLEQIRCPIWRSMFAGQCCAKTGDCTPPDTTNTQHKED
ncbi:unnamed protein product [Vitrella brassicaformis CCMP3155]|uniref:Uncharacterized protein n=1 Tax=Vitrella brassicaformis (strain CCMP3155) TaxID=1169540 RepID=A0A0G4EAC9_VITBC|nr:unnamed protein product [Vitrella brassicaformis CCMP3155]|eukprot:CEL92202.1 unnamed protein product [Vitrella brassicaformis CCMP3155]